MRRVKAAVLAVALCLGPGGAAALLVGCSSSADAGGSGGPQSGAPQHADGVIGAQGGDVATTDGVGVSIPAGALAGDVTITVDATPDAPPPSGGQAVGTPYTFGPEGTTFAVPVTVTLDFDPSLLPPGTSAKDVVVYTAPAGTTDFAPLATSVADAHHVSAQTTHFSVFVSFVASQPPTTIGPPDASADAGAPPSDDAGPGGNDAGSSGDGATAPDGGVPDAGGGNDAGVADGGVGVDAGADAGASDAGGPIDAGANDAGAPDAGVADTGVPDASDDAADVGVDTGGGGPVCSVDGSPTGNCANPPQPLCSFFPGTMVSDCTDNPGGGYTATCCPDDGGTAPGGDSGITADASIPPP